MVPVESRFFDRLHYGGMAVSGHERAEGQVVIDVLVAIEVAKLAAAGFFHEDGPGIVVAIIAGHTERNAFEIFFVRCGGFWVCGARTYRVPSVDRDTSDCSRMAQAFVI